MIDDSDGDHVLLSYNGGGGLLGAIVILVIAVIVYAIAASNKDECSKRHCAEGLQPKLVDHQCLCVGAPRRRHQVERKPS